MTSTWRTPAVPRRSPTPSLLDVVRDDRAPPGRGGPAARRPDQRPARRSARATPPRSWRSSPPAGWRFPSTRGHRTRMSPGCSAVAHAGRHDYQPAQPRATAHGRLRCGEATHPFGDSPRFDLPPLTSARRRRRDLPVHQRHHGNAQGDPAAGRAAGCTWRQAWSDWHRLSRADRGYCSLPLFHVNAEVVGLLATLRAGAYLAVDRKFSRRGFWDLISAAPDHLDQRGARDHLDPVDGPAGQSARGAALRPVGLRAAAARLARAVRAGASACRSSRPTA